MGKNTRSTVSTRGNHEIYSIKCNLRGGQQDYLESAADRRIDTIEIVISTDSIGWFAIRLTGTDLSLKIL